MIIHRWFYPALGTSAHSLTELTTCPGHLPVSVVQRYVSLLTLVETEAQRVRTGQSEQMNANMCVLVAILGIYRLLPEITNKLKCRHL